MASKKRNLKRERYKRFIACFLVVNLLAQICAPTAAWALTSGPAQEEYASFEPVETTQLVDPYSGDFTYNLPLLSVPGPHGGYPINMSYHSGVGVEQEASWVGLGWNINAGVINRQLRGLPDDLNGQNVEQEMEMKPNWSFTLNIPKAAERELYGISTGADQVSSVGAQIYYNNYKGFGYRLNLAPKKLNVREGMFSGTGLGLSIDSQNGIGIQVGASAALTHGVQNKVGLGIGATAGYNSRTGYTGFSFSTGLVSRQGRARAGSPDNMGPGNYVTTGNHLNFPTSTISFPSSSYVSQVSTPMSITNTSLGLKLSVPGPKNPLNVSVVPYTVRFNKWLSWTGSYEENILQQRLLSIPGYGYMYDNNAGTTDLKDFSRSPIAYSKKIPNIASSSSNYDLYSVNGQGAGGMFRPYSSRVRMYSDAYKESDITNHSYNFEIGFNIKPTPLDLKLHVGFYVPTGSGYMGSGPWKLGYDDFTTAMDSHDTPGTDPLYEDSYFKMYGEKSAMFDDENPLTNTGGWGGDQAVRVKLEKRGSLMNTDFVAGTDLIPYAGGSSVYEVSSGYHNTENNRQRRATNIESLTYEQAKKYGTSRFLQYYDASDDSTDKFPGGGYPGGDAGYKDLVSEISVHQPDGMKYTYGLPAFNKVQKDASFRMDYTSHSPVTSQSGLPENNVSLVKNWKNGSNE